MRSLRIERALYRRCQRGEVEALATLLYAIGDQMYAMMLAAADGDTDQAASATAVAWQKLLSTLGRWWGGGYIPAKVQQVVNREIKRRWGEEGLLAAQDVLKQQQAGGQVPTLPAALADKLLAELPGQAYVLRQRRTQIRRLGRRILVMAAAALVVLAAIGWRLHVQKLAALAPTVRFETLQARIISSNLAGAVRDIVENLPEPETADRPVAEMLQQVGLILEEIANAGDLQGVEKLRYIRERIEHDDLAWRTAELADRYQGRWRTALLNVALALEELDNP